MGPIRLQINATDAEIEDAVELAAEQPDPPVAVAAQYLSETRLLLFRLKSGQRLAIPVEDLQDLQGASAADLAEVELLGSGESIAFSRSDYAVYVPYLVEGRYGNRTWMHQLKAKRAAASLAA